MEETGSKASCPKTEDSASETDRACKDVNQKLCSIRTLKHQNHICEQQEIVDELKMNYGSYRDLNTISGIPLKTIHGWCSIPKERQHKGTSRSKLKRDELFDAEYYLIQSPL